MDARERPGLPCMSFTPSSEACFTQYYHYCYFSLLFNPWEEERAYVCGLELDVLGLVWAQALTCHCNSTA